MESSSSDMVSEVIRWENVLTDALNMNESHQSLEESMLVLIKKAWASASQLHSSNADALYENFRLQLGQAKGGAGQRCATMIINQVKDIASRPPQTTALSEPEKPKQKAANKKKPVDSSDSNAAIHIPQKRGPKKKDKSIDSNPSVTSIGTDVVVDKELDAARQETERAKVYEIDALTERITAENEGIAFVGKKITTTLLPSEDSINPSIEEEISKAYLRQPMEQAMPNQFCEPMVATASLVPANIVDMVKIEELMKSRGILKSFTISSDASSLLSEGIQQHMKNVIEAVVGISRKRTNESVIRTYEELAKALAQNEVAQETLMDATTFSWGPDVRAILQAEENQAVYLYKMYSSAEKSRILANESIIGGKRKLEQTNANAVNWRQADEQGVREGRYSLQELADANFRALVADSTKSHSNKNKGVEENTIEKPHKAATEMQDCPLPKEKAHINSGDVKSVLKEYLTSKQSALMYR